MLVAVAAGRVLAGARAVAPLWCLLFGIGLLDTACAGCAVPIECGGARHPPGEQPVLSATRGRDGATINELVVFGDSLSDTGALLAQSHGIAPNPDGYFAGRFSNGPIWVDYVADALSLSAVSHAYGGAATHGDPGATPRPFDAAVDEYLDCVDGDVDGDDVFALWIGHNDYYQGADDTDAVVDNALAALQRLVDSGARQFLVPELLPLSGTPRPVQESAGGLDDDTADERVQAHNAALRDGLDQLEQSLDVTIARAVPRRMRDRVLAAPTLLGLQDTTTACYSGDVYWFTGGQADMCDDPDGVFFWDGVHPSTRVHCAYAIEMLRALREAGLAGAPRDDDALLDDCRSVVGALGPPSR